ncbi:hypothetical protein M378DRAFT_168419, partial [Amanita muscaria Koide BX008]
MFPVLLFGSVTFHLGILSPFANPVLSPPCRIFEPLFSYQLTNETCLRARERYTIETLVRANF